MQTANQTVDYTFDQLNRLKTVTDASGTTTYNYDAVGKRASQVNANGVIVSYSYDPLNRLTDLVHTNSLGDEIASYAYELGPNGNRLSLTEGTGRVVEYDYDELYRLLSETVTDPVNGNHFSQWSYDPVGNRLQQDIDGVVTLYTYDDNDLLLTETEDTVVTSYDYDNNGNTLEKTVDGLVDATYSYSKDNRMLSANTNGSSISYTYDAGGIRQSQTVDGTTTHYLVDPNRSYHQVLEEQDDLFLPQVTYTYGDDLISQTNSQGTHTFGYDGLGSTRVLTDSAGAVQNSYGYQAFGELDYQYGTVENNYLFTGEQYDNNVGFYYLRARYYNPEIGRFQNMDTFPGMQFEPKSLHKYLYTHADPINNIDPSGNVSLLGIYRTSLDLIRVVGGFAVSTYNLVDKVETAISLYQAVHGLYAAWNTIKSAGLSYNIQGDHEFNNAMQNLDDAFYVLTKNMGRLFGAMKTNEKQKIIKSFIKNPKSILLVFGPTPKRSSPWVPTGTRTKIGRIGIGKKKKDMFLELGRSSGKGGRLTGIGHSFKGGQNSIIQWWRMDYHSTEGHGEGSNDWSDGAYHFHTTTTK